MFTALADIKFIAAAKPKFYRKRSHTSSTTGDESVLDDLSDDDVDEVSPIASTQDSDPASTLRS
jgi:hypothetical protein